MGNTSKATLTSLIYLVCFILSICAIGNYVKYSKMEVILLCAHSTLIIFIGIWLPIIIDHVKDNNKGE